MGPGFDAISLMGRMHHYAAMRSRYTLLSSLEKFNQFLLTKAKPVHQTQTLVPQAATPPGHVSVSSYAPSAPSHSDCVVSAGWFQRP